MMSSRLLLTMWELYHRRFRVLAGGDSVWVLLPVASHELDYVPPHLITTPIGSAPPGMRWVTGPAASGLMLVICKVSVRMAVTTVAALAVAERERPLTLDLCGIRHAWSPGRHLAFSPIERALLRSAWRCYRSAARVGGSDLGRLDEETMNQVARHVMGDVGWCDMHMLVHVDVALRPQQHQHRVVWMQKGDMWVVALSSKEAASFVDRRTVVSPAGAAFKKATECAMILYQAAVASTKCPDLSFSQVAACSSPHAQPAALEFLRKCNFSRLRPQDRLYLGSELRFADGDCLRTRVVCVEADAAFTQVHASPRGWPTWVCGEAAQQLFAASARMRLGIHTDPLDGCISLGIVKGREILNGVSIRTTHHR